MKNKLKKWKKLVGTMNGILWEANIYKRTKTLQVNLS